MATPSLLFFFIFLLPILTGGDPIHDLLKAHGLPPGLLPKSVANFTFDPSTSLLEAYLEKPCYAKYDSLAYFDRVVTGNLSYGVLKGVDGFKQEELFVWLPVKGIFNKNPESGVILFDIGLAHKQLSMSLFETPPECRPDGVLGDSVGGSLGRRGGIHEQR
ncbi:uncharacterized protein A4U43_C03F9200 [Asparagus officinalis]|uniref:Uncharacterized protein n=1 Tax=Asparagus officinalis TaxID=4686 RepID=A0A5P1F8I7_ASPOF|nr:uncharacterized protein At5g01610-like [Asparagus officinalis]ONK74696.1 uncharacterized protein A4U43_C03F9200 [Asparagus officinalis]